MFLLISFSSAMEIRACASNSAILACFSKISCLKRAKVSLHTRFLPISSSSHSKLVAFGMKCSMK